jgi:hypothetical protein
MDWLIDKMEVWEESAFDDEKGRKRRRALRDVALNSTSVRWVLRGH